jgi:uncharacterized repeat protein (TIGR01451 family)
VPVGSSITYTLIANISAGATGTLATTATVTAASGTTDSNLANNTASDSDTQASVADLQITKSDGSATYTPGGNVTYSIVVTNVGPSNVTGAAISDALPSGIVTANWAAMGAGGASGFTASGSGPISDTVNLPVNGTIFYTVTMAVPMGRTGNLVNTATVAPPSGVTDPNMTNNSATDTDTQASVADLQVTKTDGSATYQPYSTTTYNIVVTNAGPSNATGVTISDPLPSGITTAAWSAVGTGGANGFVAGGIGAISGTANMPAGSTITYTVTMSIPGGRTGNLVNTVTVTPPAGVTDPNPGNNTATDTDTQTGGGLPLSPAYPLITGNNPALTATAYNASTGIFTSNSIPAAALFSAAGPPALINGGTLAINVAVNSAGQLVGSGTATNDLTINGTVKGPGNVTYNGPLLTGKVIAFGSQELGTVDKFQLVFQVTGGSLAGFYTGHNIGIVITAENSTFNNSFAVNFSSGSKFNLGLVN